MSNFANANQGISPSQNYYAAGLYAPEILPYMLRIKKWENNINGITTQLGSPIYRQNVVFQQFFTESNLPTGVVSNRSVPTGFTTTLTITVDPDQDFGRVEGIIVDAITQTKAKITAKNQNTYTLNLFASGTSSATFASSDFANGNAFTYVEVSPKYRLAGNIESQYNTADSRYIAMQVFEEHCSLHMEDFTDKKWNVLAATNAENANMFGLWQVSEMADRFAAQLERNYCGFTPQNIVDSSGLNKTNSMAGLPAQIRQNGFFNEYSSFSEYTLQQTIQYMRDTKGGSTNILCMCGTDFMAWFQNTISDKYLVPMGELNLFGGKSIEGLNVVTYSYLGCKVSFMIYNGFNNTNWFPAYSTVNPAVYKYKSSAMFLNTDACDTAMDGTQPFLSRYCYGTGEGTMRDGQLKIVPKGIDQNGKSLAIATSAQDFCDWDIKSVHTILLNDPTRHAYMGLL